MKGFLSGLKFWWRPLALFTLFWVSGFIMITASAATLWGPAIPITIIAGVLCGIDIYGHLAERHYLQQKSGPNSEVNYKKELRRLERLHKKKVRESFAYKNYGSGKTYHREALELEKRIEAHKNGDEYPTKVQGRTSRY